MTDDLITIRLRLTGGTEAAAEVKGVSREISGLDDTTASATVSTSKATKESSKFRSAMSGVGRTIRYASIPVIGALAYETVRSVNAFRESRKVGLQTEAVIKSTGRAAGVTADEVARLAGNLSLKTGVDDEEIQAGANMLLTFKNIRNEVGKGNDIFNQATSVINDMSSALGQDMKSSAIQLGKALNDPVAGITALSRVGVTFDDQTKKTIERLVKQGKTLKAQKIILKELTSEFGGSAKAQHDAVDRLGVAWENLEEQLGQALYPVLKDITQWLTKAIRQAEHGKGPLIDLKDGFVDAGHAIRDTVHFIQDLAAPFRTAVDLMEKWRDLTTQLVLTAPDLSAASDFTTGLTAGLGNNPQAGHGGQSHPGPQGKLPELVPVTTTAGGGGGGGGGKVVHLHTTIKLDGKKVAQNTTKHALEADARR